MIPPLKTKKRFTRLIIIVILIISAILIIVKYYHKPKESTELKNSIENNEEQKVFEAPILNLDDINVKTPIVLDVDGEKKGEYFLALKNGVAHMKGTSKPGENGNIVVFGHSSATNSYDGDYKEVFKKLNDLETGSIAQISDGANARNLSMYKLVEKKIVDAKEVSVVKQSEKNILTLITCWPIGSDRERLVLVFEQIN